MARLPAGLKDVKIAIGVVVGMLLAGLVLPLASPEQGTGTALTAGAPATGTPLPQGNAAAPLPGTGQGPGGTGPKATTGPAGGPAAPGTGTGVGPSGTASPGADSGAPGATTGPTAVAPGTDPSASGPAPAPGATEAPTVAGPGATDAPAPGETPPGAPAPGAELTASDQGVTPETVTFGVALLNLDSLKAAGMGATAGSVEERRRVWQGLIDVQNAAGGAAGRKIELAAEDFDPLNTSTVEDSCRALAEDHQVFVIAADPGYANVTLCSTRQYGIPTFAYDSQDLTTFSEARGLLWTSMPSNDRMLANEAYILHERKLIEGKTLGLVTREGFSTAYDNTQIPTYDSLGHTFAHRSNLSQDISTAQSQIPVEIQQMRSAGVDFIVWSGDPSAANTWINQAQKTGFNPTYSFSEFGSGTDDFNLQTVSQRIDAYGWATRRVIERRTDTPEAATDAACIAKAEKGSGMSIERSTDLYWNTIRYCAYLRAFVDGFNAAGPNPTRPDFAAYVSNLGQRKDLDVGPGGVGGTWTPGKADASDYLHMIRADIPGCRCWRPEGDWFPMRSMG